MGTSTQAGGQRKVQKNDSEKGTNHEKNDLEAELKSNKSKIRKTSKESSKYRRA